MTPRAGTPRARPCGSRSSCPTPRSRCPGSPIVSCARAWRRPFRCTLALLDLEFLADAPVADGELEEVGAAITVLRDAGIPAALARADDRSAIGQLRRLPLDTLRLERAAIERLGTGFLAAISAIARALGLRVAVTDVDALRGVRRAFAAHAPDEIAGVLIGVAMPATEVLTPVSAIDAAVTEHFAERGREPTVPAFSIE